LTARAEIAARIEGRLERLGLSAEAADRLAGLPAGSVLALAQGAADLPRGAAFRRLAAALEVDEAFLLGLEPGDLMPPEMLEEAQGELGLLAPDEEALLRNYRRLDVPTRAAIGLLVSRAAGPDLGQRDEVPPVARRAARREGPA
jgi:hypothetical protein